MHDREPSRQETADAPNPYAAPPPDSQILAPRSEITLASRWTRLAAFITNQVIWAAVMTPLVLMLIVATTDAVSTDELTPFVVGLGFAAFVFLGFFALQCYLLSARGQDVGKIIFRLRIVRHEDYGNPGFLSAVSLRWWLNQFITGVPWAGWAYALIDGLMIFRQDRRCVHDQIAKTIVIEEPTAIAATEHATKTPDRAG